MTQRTMWWRAAGVGLVLALCLASPAAAQRQRAAAGQPQREIAVAEIQRLFSAYAVMQSQEALGLSDDQFARFLPRMRAVQDVRRRLDAERARITVDLARMAAPSQTTLDEPGLSAKLKELADLEARSAAELKAAYEALDQTLDLRQQARFRVFELQMERRKFDLMLRARRGQAPGLPQ